MAGKSSTSVSAGSGPGSRAIESGAVLQCVDLVRRRAASVVLLADTHGFLDSRVEAVARDGDLCVHAGDVGGSGVVDQLRRACPRLLVVRGNNDVASKWSPSEQDLLEALPSTAQALLPGGRLVVVHGDRHNPVAARHEKLRRAFPDARCIVYGHSHRLVIDDAETTWVLNPGAAGRARTRGGPSCLRLLATRRVWSVEALRFPLLPG